MPHDDDDDRRDESCGSANVMVCRVIVEVHWPVTTVASGSRWASRRSRARRGQVTYLECLHVSPATCRGYVTSWSATGQRRWHRLQPLLMTAAAAAARGVSVTG